jgi:DNA-binding beta-propeller fold protein YncE
VSGVNDTAAGAGRQIETGLPPKDRRFRRPVAGAVATVAVVGAVVLGLHLAAVASSAAAATPVAQSPGAQTLAGTGAPGPRLSLDAPAGIAEDAAGDLFIADAGGCRVVELPAHDGHSYGRALTAGTPVTLAGGTCSSAHPSPTAMAVDTAGDLFIAYGPANRVEELPARSGTAFGQAIAAGRLVDVAGTGTPGFSGDGGPAAVSTVDDPTGVATDGAGDVFVGDTANGRVRMVAASDGTHFGVAMQEGHIYTVAGNGLSGSSGDGGPARQAELWDPGALAVDSSGDLFIADQGNRTIRVLTTRAGTFFGVSLGADDVGTVAGEGSYGPYLIDGLPAVGDTAEINFPSGLAFDARGDLYIADGDMQVIRMVAAGTAVFRGKPTIPDAMYTAAGAFGVGPLRDQTSWVRTRLDDPTGVAVSPAGRLVYSDSVADVVRELPAAT